MPDANPLEQIDAIYRSAPIGLGVLDRELRYVRVNDRLAAINRVPAAAHIGRRVREVLPEVAHLIEPLLLDVLGRREPLHGVEISAPPGPDGAVRTVRGHFLPLLGRDGSVAGINVVVEDITERKQTEERLHTVERRLWLQTEHSPMAVIEWDASYNVTRWGGAAEAMFGWRADEVLGLPIADLNIVYEEDWPIVERAMARMTAADSPHVISSNRNYTRDRRILICDWYNSVVADADGRLASVLSLVVDVTESRRGQAEQQLLAEASHQLADIRDPADALSRLARLPVPALADWCALGVADADGGIRLLDDGLTDHPDAQAVARACAEAALATAAGMPQPDALRVNRALLIAPAELGVLRSRLDAHRAGAAPVSLPRSLLVVPLRVKDRTVGVWTWGRTRAQAFDDRDLAFAEELTNRAATALLHLELFEAVQCANAAKDRFIATLGHELRQPLGALTAALAVLRNTTGPTAERAHAAADRQVRLAVRLMDDLLDLSRIERGILTLQREHLDLRRIVEAAVEGNAHLLAERGQRLDLKLSDRPVTVTGDAARLQQVVSNLLHNACKFTPEGGALRLALDVTGTAATIRVRDSGRGITRGVLERIFEPFAQAEPGSGKGLGIGLAVVRQLVGLHGGSVTASSAGEGQGSTFVVTLPLADQPLDAGSVGPAAPFRRRTDA